MKTITPLETRQNQLSPELIGGPGLLHLFAESPSFARSARRVHRLDTPLTVGRQDDQRLVVEDDGSLSRVHAIVELSGPQVIVRDLGSSNGTFVNGAAISEPTTLSPGDVVRCGGNLLLMVPGSAPYARWPADAERGPLLGGPRIDAVRRWIAAVAPRKVEVLIHGESGTGKEVAARQIHALSGRSGPFVPVNCAAIPEALFEAELFGAKRGAFTGATADRPGLMQQARGGTLFLDEIGELPLALQAKLLRAVELCEVRAVGSDRVVRVDTRLVLATNRDLQREVDAGRFRQDLMYRIRSAVLELPPLRERRDDVVVLAEHFLTQVYEREGARFELGARVLEQLLLYSWPGNVRELDRVLREATVQATISGEQGLRPSHLRASIREGEPREKGELARLRQALQASAGNVSQAAAELGVRRAEVYRLLKAHNLQASDFRSHG